MLRARTVTIVAPSRVGPDCRDSDSPRSERRRAGRRRGTVAAYVVEVSDVTAKVGEPAVMRATLEVRDGYRILEPYNNRVIELSSFDDGVDFEHRMVPAR